MNWSLMSRSVESLDIDVLNWAYRIYYCYYVCISVLLLCTEV